VLNGMFVSDLCGLASLPFHPQRSCSPQHVYASVDASLMPFSVLHVSQISVNNIPTLFLL